MKGAKSRTASRTLSVRLPNHVADIVEAAARSSGQTTSEFIEAALNRQGYQLRPQLAALAALQQIAHRVRRGEITTLAMADIEVLVSRLASEASHELAP